ncbi:hypothetical protein ACIBL5_34090 [Streptomyces sp. NPDC050516]|uniref:hypothetical protein n=1 Tax=Streptomyces sp. NPDC050516 TaxID=3365621 RepID=UPI00379CF041
MKNTKRLLTALALTDAALSLSGTAQAAEPDPVRPNEVVEIQARPVIVEEAPRTDFDRDLAVAERVEQDQLVEALVSDFLGDDDELIRVDNENV